jgi:hypothetical protein
MNIWIMMNNDDEYDNMMNMMNMIDNDWYIMIDDMNNRW